MVKKILKMFRSGILSVLILSIVKFFYSTSGIPVVVEGIGTDHCYEPYSWVHFCTEGIAHFKMDANGYNNELAMEPGEMDYLLMGSSHMEALQVPQNQNFTFLLNHGLKESVYNIGISSHYLAKSLSYLGNAIEYHAPQKGLIIEIPSVTESKLSLEKVNNGESLKTPIKYNTHLMRFIRKYLSGLSRILLNLKTWANISLPVEHKDHITPVYDYVYWGIVDIALSNAANYVHSKGLDFYILIHPSVSIDGLGNVEPLSNQKEIDAFEAICNRHDITLINPYDKFVETYETEHKLPNGFINTAVGIGHMNEVGHRLSAEAAIEAIEAREAR